MAFLDEVFNGWGTTTLVGLGVVVAAPLLLPVVGTVVLSGVILWLRPSHSDVYYSRAALALFLVCTIAFVVNSVATRATSSDSRPSPQRSSISMTNERAAPADSEIDEKVLLASR